MTRPSITLPPSHLDDFGMGVPFLFESNIVDIAQDTTYWDIALDTTGRDIVDIAQDTTDWDELVEFYTNTPPMDIEEFVDQEHWAMPNVVHSQTLSVNQELGIPSRVVPPVKTVSEVDQSLLEPSSEEDPYWDELVEFYTNTPPMDVEVRNKKPKVIPPPMHRKSLVKQTIHK